MIINIGEENYIYSEDIIAILDRKTIDSSVEGKKCFKKFLRHLNLTLAIDDDIKSYIITEKKGKTQVYFSKISSKTLENRNILSVWR